MKRRKFDSCVLLEEKLEVKSPKGKDIVYGVLYNSDEPICEQEIKDYVVYIAGCKKWLENGNAISFSKKTWIDKTTGETYDVISDFAQKWCSEAYRETPVKFAIYDAVCRNIEYKREDVDRHIIVGEQLWEELKDRVSKLGNIKWL